MVDVNWYVYIILSSDGLLYTGVTTDIKRRWDEHSGNVSGGKGAKFFRGRKPQSLTFIECHDTRSNACKRESAVKKLTRLNKLQLIASEKNQIDGFPVLKSLEIITHDI